MRIHLCLLALLLIAGCTGTGKIEEAGNEDLVEVGDTATVNYIGKIEGKVFDTNIESTGKAAGLKDKAYAPLRFKVGAGHMIDGFDKGVVWMRKGETKELIIPPEEGYGPTDKELIKLFPIEEGMSMDVGGVVEFRLADQTVRGIVLGTNGTHMVVDFNHILAGKTLIFEVTVLDIEKAT